MKKIKPIPFTKCAASTSPPWLEHFFFMSANNIKIASECANLKPYWEEEREFVALVKKALRLVKSEYWISTLEPTIRTKFYNTEKPFFNATDKIVFEKGVAPENSLHFFEWEECAKRFSPIWQSDISYWYEWILFLAYRIAKGYCNLNYVCKEFYDYDRPSQYHSSLAPTGKIKSAGFYDGLFNTGKITKNNIGHKYVIFNTSAKSHNYLYQWQLAEQNEHNFYSVPVVVLRRNVTPQSTVVTQEPEKAKIQDNKTDVKVKDERLIRAKNTIDLLQQISDSTNFGENDKQVSLIVKKLYEALQAVSLDISKYPSFALLFDVYADEFYKELDLYATLKKEKRTTSDEEKLFTESVVKFLNYLSENKLDSSIDIERVKIDYSSTAKTFLSLFDKK